MLYLSRIALDLGKRKTLQAMAAPNLFHGAIEESMPDHKEERKLWRIDRLNGTYYLLMQTPRVPDLTSIVKQFGQEPCDLEKATKKYDVYLDQIRNGERLQFRLTANPTYRKYLDSGKQQICAHMTPDFQRKWFTQKSAVAGFTVQNNEFEVMDKRWLHFRKKRGSREISLLSVSFEGILTVTDASKFCQSLKNGFGREKAYGMGMMTVIRKL